MKVVSYIAGYLALLLPALLFAVLKWAFPCARALSVNR
jgi:F0F1-type ATP synthase assembly protein I